IGFAVSRGHWMDLGGGAAGGMSFGTHIAAEGLRLPPIKLYQNYEVNEDFLAIIMNNTRTPHYIRGDLQAHLGALKSAEGELQRAAERYGIETVKSAMNELI
ncbi:hydantoinase B/oxoprolinase family protein, partial [Salmonella sp. 15E51]|uniref:hydantoinase B/oxoprolinase family protein n=1 Tax=Salmonella sp. 15E51 TaxID=2933329 RepID=UPI001FF53AC8